MYCKVLCTKVPRNTTYSVYCNRFVHVNITLTHARSTAYPSPSANRKPPHAECIQTRYVYTQYVQVSVLSQFASPPGGECTYHICNCSVAFTLIFVYLERIKNLNFTYSNFGKIKSLLPETNADSGIKSSLQNCKDNLCRITLTSGLFSSAKWLASNVSHIPVQISVRYRLLKMSVPGEESQPSMQSSAGEYLCPTCTFTVIYALLRAGKYLCSICTARALGELSIWYPMCNCREYNPSFSSYIYNCAIRINTYRCDGSNRYGE
jgi:hypothetical protein